MTLRRPISRLPGPCLGDLPSGDSMVTVPRNGTYAGRPAAGSVLPGEIYFATDKKRAYRSTGSAWEMIGMDAIVPGNQMTVDATDINNPIVGMDPTGMGVWQAPIIITGAIIKALPNDPALGYDNAPPNNLTCYKLITLAAGYFIDAWMMDLITQIPGGGPLTSMNMTVTAGPYTNHASDTDSGLTITDVIGGSGFGGRQISPIVNSIAPANRPVGGGSTWYVWFQGGAAIGTNLGNGGSIKLWYRLNKTP